MSSTLPSLVQVLRRLLRLDADGPIVGTPPTAAPAAAVPATPPAAILFWEGVCLLLSLAMAVITSKGCAAAWCPCVHGPSSTRWGFKTCSGMPRWKRCGQKRQSCWCMLEPAAAVVGVVLRREREKCTCPLLCRAPSCSRLPQTASVSAACANLRWHPATSFVASVGFPSPAICLGTFADPMVKLARWVGRKKGQAITTPLPTGPAPTAMPMATTPRSTLALLMAVQAACDAYGTKTSAAFLLIKFSRRNIRLGWNRDQVKLLKSF